MKIQWQILVVAKKCWSNFNKHPTKCYNCRSLSTRTQWHPMADELTRERTPLTFDHGGVFAKEKMRPRTDMTRQLRSKLNAKKSKHLISLDWFSFAITTGIITAYWLMGFMGNEWATNLMIYATAVGTEQRKGLLNTTFVTVQPWHLTDVSTLTITSSTIWKSRCLQSKWFKHLRRQT